MWMLASRKGKSLTVLQRSLARQARHMIYPKMQSLLRSFNVPLQEINVFMPCSNLKPCQAHAQFLSGCKNKFLPEAPQKRVKALGGRAQSYFLRKTGF